MPQQKASLIGLNNFHLRWRKNKKKNLKTYLYLSRGGRWLMGKNGLFSKLNSKAKNPRISANINIDRPWAVFRWILPAGDQHQLLNSGEKRGRQIFWLQYCLPINQMTQDSTFSILSEKPQLVNFNINLWQYHIKSMLVLLMLHTPTQFVLWLHYRKV